MIKNNRNNEQIYGRNDMIMLDQNNKIYGSLGLADKYVMRTEEGTRLVLNNPKQGRFGDVLTEFNMYGRSEQKQYKGINLFPPNTGRSDFVEVSIPKGSSVFWVTDGIPATGGNFRFFNEDKTEYSWFGVDAGSTSGRHNLTIDVKYVQNLLDDFDQSKICLGVGTKPIYEPYVGGKPSPSPEYPQEIKSVVNPTVKVTNEDGLKVQSVTLNDITLNAIPVSSGGNVTINGQQYVADYVDVERGKVVRCVKREPLSKNGRLSSSSVPFYTYNLPSAKPKTITEVFALCNLAQFNSIMTSNSQIGISSDGSNSLRMRLDGYATLEQYTRLSAEIIYELATPIEEDLTSEQITAFKELVTYYPVTIVENNYNTWMKATYKSMESV